MKKRMEQLAKGNFIYRAPELILSQKEIRHRLKEGEKAQGEIFLGTQENVKLKGFINSTHRRLIPQMERFSGTSFQLRYGVDTLGLSAGEGFLGELVLSTNVGEYRIPCQVEIQEETVTSAWGEIRDLESFAALAKRDFREAFRLFAGPGFAARLAGNSPRAQALYFGMSENPVTYQHLEEYLIAAGLKEPVSIQLKEENASFFALTQDIQESFAIVRSGWGHLRLEVEWEGDFLEVGKRVITQEDFLGSVYALEYIVRTDTLKKGRHFGRILVRSPYKTLTFSVMATRNQAVKVDLLALEKRCCLSLSREYLQFRLGRLEEGGWLASGFHLVRELREKGLDYPKYRLWEAFFYERRREREKAREILAQYRETSFSKGEEELAGGYLYLCYRTGLLESKGEACRKLCGLYQQKRESFFLFYLLFLVDEEYAVSPQKAARQLEELFELGRRSPLLYFTAWELVKKNKGLLRRMEGLWIQVFLFAGREGLLEEELNMRMVYLSGYVKEFSKSLYRALCVSYERFPVRDTLEALCKYLMLAPFSSPDYFRWYEKAVEEGLRLTRLYENYVETCGRRTESLPRALKMFFLYENSLRDEQKAYVYANILRHEKEDETACEQYRERMRAFAEEKLLEGRIGEDYGTLYQAFFSEWREGPAAEKLGEALFTFRLCCRDPKVRQVAVRHSQMRKEEVYPVVHGVAYPRIYRKDAAVLFVDERRRRYVSTVDYSLTPLMDGERLARGLSRKLSHPGFLLYLCKDEEISDESAGLYRRLAAEEAFTGKYRDRIRKKLLDYYRNPRNGQESFPGREEWEDYARVDKRAFLEILIDRGLCHPAYQIFCRYGGEGVSVERRLKLCSRQILEREGEEDEELLSLAWEIYQEGKYNDVLLEYLLKYGMGAMDQMYGLWERARAFSMDTYDFEERLLGLLMFQLDYRPQGARVLENYVKQAGKEQVIRAYLTFSAYGYFMKSQPLQPFVRACLQKALEREWELDAVCGCALLQSLCAGREWNSRQMRLAGALLEKEVSAGHYFGFYRRLPKELLRPYRLDDKVFVEYRADPEAEVVLHYALDPGLGAEAPYQSEPLKSGYPGVFLKMFTLFYGETLRYYFTWEAKGRTGKTQEKTVSVNRVDEEGGGQYQMLNKILAARKLKKDREVRERLEEFLSRRNYERAMHVIERE